MNVENITNEYGGKMSNMFRLSVLVAAASLCAAVAQSASAADLPLPTKEPVIAPAFILDRILHRR